MRLGRTWAIAIPIVLALTASACRSTPAEEEAGPDEGPVTVEQADGSSVATITMTEDGARRIDLQTTAIRASGGHLEIPYSAVLYDPEGDTWTYVSPEHLVFQRAPITVKRIVGDTAILSSGPPAGTEVVSVGQSELLGSEYEVEGE
jgi:multidrug efflux pump subunit AcrA (membrane-fusion protein)